jgi:surface protein
VSLVYRIPIFCFEALMMVFTLILSLSPLFSLEMWLTRDENDCGEAKEDAAKGVVEGAEKKTEVQGRKRGVPPASTISARDYGPSETILMRGGGCTGIGVSISKANEVSESSESWPVRRHGVTMARLLLAVIALPGIDAVGVDSATLTTSPYGRVLNSYTPLTDSNVKTAAQLWVSNQASAASTYGLVDSWDLSQVTSLANVWCGYDATNCGSAYVAMRSFNGDISRWDVSKVTSMSASKSIRIFPNEVT